MGSAQDGGSDAARAAVEPHLEPGEVVRLVVTGYSGMTARVILGVTDRRVLAVRSAYWMVKGKGLMWADPLSAVKILGKPSETKVGPQGLGQKSGNVYVTLQRADGKKFVFNPRNGFFAHGGAANAKRLSDAIPIV